MTTLIERCQAASMDLAGVEAARRNAHLRATIQQRTQEWNAQLAKLTTAQERSSWIDLVPEQVAAYVERRSQLHHNAKEAVDRLTVGEDASALTADALWTRLLQSAAATATALEEAIKAAWATIIQAPGKLASPLELQSKLPATPSNQHVLATYGRHYAIYARLSVQTAPRTINDKENFDRAVADCHAELAKVDYDVPKDVEAFFRAVYSNTARLSSVTPNVLRWLDDNGHLDRFIVRSMNP